jgi:thiol peroxidase
MAQVTLKGNPFNTCGELPATGSSAPNSSVVKNDLSEVTLDSYLGKKVILNVFPSIDTPTCATSTRRFNSEAANLNNTVVVCVSADLPFAQKRFCAAEGIDNVETASTFRSSFGKDYGVEFVDGPLLGLLSRSIIVVDEKGNVIYSQQVAETADEPDYDAAIAALS